MADVCGLLLIVVAISAGPGAYAFATLSGVPAGSGAERVQLAGWVAAAVGVFLWLSYLVIERSARWPVRLTAVVLGMAAVATGIPTPGQGMRPAPGSTGNLVLCAALGWLVVEICRIHGIDRGHLGIHPPGARTRSSRLAAWVIGAQAVVVCYTTILLYTITRHLTLLLWPQAPVLRTTQAQAVGLDSPWDVIPAGIYAVMLEDVILIGAVTALMTAARRPAWMIYAIVGGLEVAVHGYFGLPAVAFAAFAWGRVWLYRRYARLTPLMLGHYAYDVGLTLLPTRAVLCLNVPVLLLAMVVSRSPWMRERDDAPARPPAQRSS